MATTKTTTTKKKTTTKKSSTTKKKKTSGTQIIPGVNLTISWKKLLGITKLKRWFTSKTGIPTTEAGIQRKIGRWLISLVTGKGNKQESKKKTLAENNQATKPVEGAFSSQNKENAQ